MAQFIPLILTVLSTAYQIYQSAQAAKAAKAAKKKRDEAEDARKGFESVVEGESTILPIVYGKAKIGGARVFHGVSGSFNYVASNADKVMGLYLNGVMDTQDIMDQYTCTVADTIKNSEVVILGEEAQEWVVPPIGPVNPPSLNKIVCLIPYDDPTDQFRVDNYIRKFPKTWANFIAGGTGEILYQMNPSAPASKTFKWVLATKKNEQTPLINSITGTKNEFLYYQQALCQGPINAVHDVIIDDSRYLDDVELGCETEIKQNDKGKDVRVKKEAGLRIDYHYGNSPVADAIMGANFYERTSATFDGMAYASVVIRLDRDYPQFNSIPNMQFLITGKKIRNIEGSEGFRVLSSTREYSNNPALCLLDYLLDPLIGKNLNVSEIDLDSFVKARDICNTVVMPSVRVGGKLYFPTLDANSGPTVGALTRSLPLYECNIIVNPEKTIRENVEEILATMGDARLVWSQGTYKLNMQYPSSNSAIEVAATITDDDLVLNQDVEISWPSASERMNQCTIKYHNETNNFEESSVSWPPKAVGDFWFGIGGTRYSTQDGFNTDKACGRLLNDYGVWAKVPETDTECAMSWHFYIKENTNTVAMTWAFADSFSLQLLRVTDSDGVTPANELIYQNSNSDPFGYSCNDTERGSYGQYSTNRTLVGGCIYRIDVTNAFVGTANSKKGFAALLWEGSDTNKKVYWKTTDPAYTWFYKRSVTQEDVDAVYNKMLEEDSGLELEKEIFAEGVTDYYHALAKAEELVRTSRSATGFKFNAALKDKYLEPGDFIKIESKALQLNSEELYARINEIKVNDDYTYQITADRFDYTQLAWNVDDDEYIYPKPIYDITLPAPAWLKFTKEDNLEQNTVGYLTWASVESAILDSYVLYFNIDGVKTESGLLDFNWMGESKIQPFYVPFKSGETVYYGIRARSKTGKLSNLTTTFSGNPITPPTPVYPPVVSDLTVSLDMNNENTAILSWSIPLLKDDGSEYNNHGGTQIYRGIVRETDAHSQIGLVGPSLTTFSDGTMLTNIDYFYSVRLVTTRGAVGSFSNVTGPIHYGEEGGPEAKPGPPTGFSVKAGTTMFIYETDPPAFNNYYLTRIYGYLYPLYVKDSNDKWVLGPVPDTSERTFEWVKANQPNGGVLASFNGTFYFDNVGPSKGGRFWATWIKRYNDNYIESDYSGPIDANTEPNLDEIWPDIEGPLLDLIRSEIDLIPPPPDITEWVNGQLIFERMQRIDIEEILSQQITLERFERINITDILQGELAAVRTVTDTITDDTQSLAYQLTQLASEFNGNQTAIQVTLETLATELMTMSSIVTILESSFLDNLSIINEIKLTYVTKDEVSALISEGVFAMFGDIDQKISAGVLTETEARVTADGAMASQITTLSASFGDSNTVLYQIKNTYASKDEARAYAREAMAASITKSVNQLSDTTFRSNITSGKPWSYEGNATWTVDTDSAIKFLSNNNEKTLEFTCLSLATGSAWVSLAYYNIPILPMKWYEISAKICAFSCEGRVYVKWLNMLNEEIGNTSTLNIDLSSTNATRLPVVPSNLYGTNLWDYGTAYNFIRSPLEAVRANFYIVAKSPAAAGAILRVIRPYFGDAVADYTDPSNPILLQTKPTDWSPGQDIDITAAILDESLIRVNAEGALSQRTTILESNYNNHTALINDIKQTYATNSGVGALVSTTIAAAYGKKSGNLLTDAMFRTDLMTGDGVGKPWEKSSNNYFEIRNDPPIYLKTNSGEKTIQFKSLNILSGHWDEVRYYEIPVKSDTWYELSVHAVAFKCTVEVYVKWYSSSAFISETQSASPSTGTKTDNSTTDNLGNYLSDYTQIFNFAKSPSLATRAQLVVRARNALTANVSMVRIIRPYFGIAPIDPNNVVIPSQPTPWTHGGEYDSIAAVKEVKTAFTDANNAWALKSTELAASIGGANAAIADIKNVYATKTYVSASITTTLAARFTGTSNLLVDTTFRGALESPGTTSATASWKMWSAWQANAGSTYHYIAVEDNPLYKLVSVGNEQTIKAGYYRANVSEVNTSGYFDSVYQPEIAIIASTADTPRYYQGSAYVWPRGCTVTLIARWLDVNNSVILADYGANLNGGASKTGVSNTTSTKTLVSYVRLFNYFKAPIGAVKCKFELLITAYTAWDARVNIVRPYFGRIDTSTVLEVLELLPNTGAGDTESLKYAAEWSEGRDVDSYAAIRDEAYVRATEDTALATKISTVYAAHNTANAAIQTIYNTYATNSQVQAIATTTVQAVMGYGTNLVKDPTFQALPVMTTANLPANASIGVWLSSPQTGYLVSYPGIGMISGSSEKTLKLSYTKAGASPVGVTQEYYQYIPVKGGAYYVQSAYVLPANTITYIFAYYRKADGSWCYPSSNLSYTVGTNNIARTDTPNAGTGEFLSDYKRLVNSGQVPADCKILDLRIVMFMRDTATPDCSVRMVRPYVSEITQEIHNTIQNTGLTFTARRAACPKWDAGSGADNYALLQQRFLAGTDATGKPYSSYTVRADVNGRITGFGFDATNNFTSFGIVADRFYIANPSSTNLAERPFVYENGVLYVNSAVMNRARIEWANIANAIITEAYIQNLTVGRTKLADNSVTSIAYTYNTASIAGSGYINSVWRDLWDMAVVFNLSQNTKNYHVADFEISVTGDVRGVAIRIYWGPTEHIYRVKMFHFEDSYVVNPETGTQIYVQNVNPSGSQYNPYKASFRERFAGGLTGSADFTFVVSVLLWSSPIPADSVRVVTRVIAK